jgi:hypothetical protein
MALPNVVFFLRSILHFEHGFCRPMFRAAYVVIGQIGFRIISDRAAQYREELRFIWKLPTTAEEPKPARTCFPPSLTAIFCKIDFWKFTVTFLKFLLWLISLRRRDKVEIALVGDAKLRHWQRNVKKLFLDNIWSKIFKNFVKLLSVFLKVSQNVDSHLSKFPKLSIYCRDRLAWSKSGMCVRATDILKLRS